MTEEVVVTEEQKEGNNLPKTMLFRMNNTGEEFIGQLVGVIPSEDDPDVTDRIIIREPVVLTQGEDDKLQFVQWCILSKNRIFNFSPDLFLMVIEPRDDIVEEYEKLIIEPMNAAEEKAQEDAKTDES